MIRLATGSVEQTRALAAALTNEVAVDDIILLAGDLGAGKTAFAQGFGAALGVDERIVSPTFTLARRYQGRVPLNHLDVYRLDHLGEVFDAGLTDLLEDGAVTLIEWGDAIIPALPREHLEVRIEFAEGADDRTFDVRGSGAGWAARVDAVAGVLEPWRC